jgi:hypothetical protein
MPQQLAAEFYLINSVQQKKKRLADPPQTDARGNDVYVSSTVTLTDVMWEPRLSTGVEETDRQQHIEEGLDLFCADPAADIEPTDEFFIDGQWFKVSAPVRRYTGSRMGNDYCQSTLRLVTG